jgi:hypothetical protein
MSPDQDSVIISSNFHCPYLYNDRRLASESPDHEVKTDNIDLFAAGPRKPAVKQLQPVIAPTPPPLSESATDSTIHDRKRSIEDMASSPGLRNSKTELRAELMRLEAEKEQLEIDKQRINDEKVRSDHI